MKKISYLGVLVASLFFYFDTPSLVFYLFAVAVTITIFHFILKLIQNFKQLSLWKKIFSMLGLLISVLVIFIFYFVAHDYANLCTVGPNIKAKNYFTGEVKDFYCGITPWYYQKLPGQDSNKFPSIKI